VDGEDKVNKLHSPVILEGDSDNCSLNFHLTRNYDDNRKLISKGEAAVGFGPTNREMRTPVP